MNIKTVSLYTIFFIHTSINPGGCCCKQAGNSVIYTVSHTQEQPESPLDLNVPSNFEDLETEQQRKINAPSQSSNPASPLPGQTNQTIDPHLEAMRAIWAKEQERRKQIGIKPSTESFEKYLARIEHTTDWQKEVEAQNRYAITDALRRDNLSLHDHYDRMSSQMRYHGRTPKRTEAEPNPNFP